MDPEQRANMLREAKPDSWLAFSADESRVVGYGSDYGEALDEALRNGENDPLLVKTPDQWNDLVLPCG